MLRPTYYPVRTRRTTLFKRFLSLRVVLFLSIVLNMVFVIQNRLGRDPVPIFVDQPGQTPTLVQQEMHWNGGHPLRGQTGTCACNSEKYCLCSPSLAIDVVLAVGKDHVYVVRRRDTNQLACMGGFVQVGESAEQAAARELKEETGLSTKGPLVLLGIYSDPRRDNRRHTTSIVYLIQLDENEHPVAADDVKDVQKIDLRKVEEYDFFADHKTILLDYRRWLQGTTQTSSAGDFAADIARTICHPTQ